MEELGALLEERMEAVLAKHGHPMRLVRMESLFWLSPGDGSPAVRADQISKMRAHCMPTSTVHCSTEAT